MKRKKPEVITFKVDESLLEAMEHIPNRSEFIRHAVQTALEHSCPLCNGTGVLSPEQQDHWKTFSTRFPDAKETAEPAPRIAAVHIHTWLRQELGDFSIGRSAHS